MALGSRRKQNIRSRLVKDQHGLCCYCQRAFTESGDRAPTIEHRKPKMDGGKDHIGNLAAACLHCNRHRGRQTMRDRFAAQKAKNYAERDGLNEN